MAAGTMNSVDSDKIATLIVEDSRVQGLQLLLELEQRGHQPLHVLSLDAGLQAVREREFDLILLDLMLPDADGLDGLERLRAVAPDTAIVMLTAHDDVELAMQALQQGAQDYLVKGQVGTLFERTLRFAYERNRIRRELDLLSAELQSKNAELERLSSIKDQFLGMAAHDLRNPLAIIDGYASILTELSSEGMSESQLDFVGKIRNSARFMRRLVDDLLDISSIASGRLDLVLDDIDLCEIAAEIVQRHQQLAAPKGVSVELVPTAGPIRAAGDAQRLGQVLDNLVSNAVKFSHSGTTTRVSVSRQGEVAIITVADEGQGIPASEIDKLFQPFERTSVRSTGGEGSTGLGLAIVQKVAELHGGHASVQSEVGKGSQFSVTIPLRS